MVMTMKPLLQVSESAEPATAAAAAGEEQRERRPSSKSAAGSNSSSKGVTRSPSGGRRKAGEGRERKRNGSPTSSASSRPSSSSSDLPPSSPSSNVCPSTSALAELVERRRANHSGASRHKEREGGKVKDKDRNAEKGRERDREGRKDKEKEKDSSVQEFLARLLAPPPTYDWADEVFLLAGEPIRLDLEEMERHLAEPHFDGHPEKVQIFYQWYDGYFCHLVSVSSEFVRRLLFHHFEPRLPEGLGPDTRGMLQDSMDDMWEAMKVVGSLKVEFTRAQPDDRANVAESLRRAVRQLSAITRSVLSAQQRRITPWLRRGPISPAEAEAAREAELTNLGMYDASMWLPWAIRAVDRWGGPKQQHELREGLPWMFATLLEFVWDPLYLRQNWGLLQSLADPIDDYDGDGDGDDGL